jgi:hypothetical protein
VRQRRPRVGGVKPEHKEVEFEEECNREVVHKN